MKKTCLLLFILSFLAGTSSMAQDLDQVLRKHFKAIGQKKLSAASSVSTKGKMLMMGMESPFEAYNKRPDKFRVNMNFQGAEIIQAYNGETGWLINPMSGHTEAAELTGTQVEGLKENADMDGALWNYSEKGHTAELVGKEEMDGTGVFVIKLTKANGNLDHYYIDAGSYLILKIKSKNTDQVPEMEAETRFGDYRTIDGITMPFVTTELVSGQEVTIKFEEVRFNEDLDDSIFEMPVP